MPHVAVRATFRYARHQLSVRHAPT
jgi:hypothetical protein